jgi:2-dehydro-3-deoxygluconokinase
MVELALTGPTSARMGVAGDTFNAAIYLQRLGASTIYGTSLGAGDPFSLAILERMADEGISADLIVQAPNRLPGLYAIQRGETGERTSTTGEVRRPRGTTSSWSICASCERPCLRLT